MVSLIEFQLCASVFRVDNLCTNRDTNLDGVTSNTSPLSNGNNFPSLWSRLN
uniref:GSVIVT01015036001, CPN21 n=1 Tax=Arundo donax TaxID=35708 RepID=A0A0A9DDR3_ARUDO